MRRRQMGTSDDDSQTSATCHQQLRRSYNACSVTKAKNGKFLNLGSTATTEVPYLNQTQKTPGANCHQSIDVVGYVDYIYTKVLTI